MLYAIKSTYVYLYTHASEIKAIAVYKNQYIYFIQSSQLSSRECMHAMHSRPPCIYLTYITIFMYKVETN